MKTPTILSRLRRSSRPLGILSALALLMSQAQAADATWSSNSSGSWITGTNWTPAAAPGATSGTTNADIATFNNIGYQTITLPTAENIGGITFATAGSSANPFFLTGGTLLPSANAVIQTDSTYLGIANINSAITAQGALTLTANGVAGSGLLISTNIATAASSTLTLNGSNSGFNGVFGNLITGVISGSSKLVKSGTGTWTLSGTNTYTGGTDLNGGMLVTNNNAAALGSSGTISVLGSTTLRTISAALTDPSARISISDNATLTMDTYGVNQTWAGVLGNSGASNTAGLTKTGLGVLTITPAAGSVQTYKGATTVNMGTLTISGASQNANFTNLIDSSSALVLGGGAINFTGKVGFTNNQTFNGTTLNAGISQFIPASSTGTNTFDFGTITRNTGSLLNITTASGYTINATGTTNDAGGAVKGVLYGSNDFARMNTNTLAAATATTSNNATAWTSNTTNYVTNAAVTGSVGSATINSLKLNFAGNNSFTIGGTLAVNDGLLFGSTIAGNPSQISGGNLTSGSGDLIIVNNNGNATFGRNTITSTIVDNGSPTNVVLYSSAQNGMLFLGGNNTYTGNTYIGGGVNAQIGTTGVTVGGAAGARIGSSNATVFLNGGTGGSTNALRVGNGDATGDVLGTIQVDNGNLILNRTDSSTLSATVRGTAGGGTITVGNTGNTTVNLDSGTNLFQSLTSTAAGTVNLGGTGTYFFNSNANGFNAASTTNFNSGTYYFNGNANTSNVLGNWVINGATVTLGNGRYFGNSGGSLTLNSGTFRVEGNNMNQEGGSGAAFTYNINGGNFITTVNANTGGSQSWGLGSGTAANTGAITANQTGGTVTVGSPENTNTSGTFSVLNIGTGTSSHASTYNLSGGTLRAYGGISTPGAAGGGGSNNFNWTGGTLTTASYNGTNLTSNDGVNSGTGTLFQGGSTSILAPGETFNGQLFTGRTAITGNYRIDAGSVSIGIGGTTAATTFHNVAAGTFDNITVTGTTVLGGNLTANLLSPNGTTFIPTNANAFAIITSTGGLSGTFGNAGNKVVLGNDPFSGSLNIVYNSGNVTLNNYTANEWSGTSANWGTGGNSAWTNAVDPNAVGTGAKFGLAGIANRAITLDQNRTVGQMLFSSGNYSIGGSSTLTLDNGASAAAITVQDATSHIISAPITLSSNLTVVGFTGGSLQLGNLTGATRNITTSTAGTLILSGTNTYANTTIGSGTTVQVGNGTTTGTLGNGTVANAGSLVFNRSDAGLSVANVISGAGNVTQSGSGTTTLTSANDYTGTTAISAGTLRLSGNGTLGATTSTLGVIASGAVLDLNGTNQTIGQFSGTSAGQIQNNSGSGTSALTVGGSSNSTFAGILADNNTVATGGRVGLSLTGAGAVTLSGNNTYTGGTLVGGTSTVVIGGSSTIISGNVTGGATGTGNVTFADGASLSTSSNGNTWYAPMISLQGSLNLVNTQRLQGTFATMELNNGTRTVNLNGFSKSVSGNALTAGEGSGQSNWEISTTNSLGTPVIQNGTLDLQTTATGSNYGLFRINNATNFSNADVNIGNNVILLASNTSSLGSNATTSPNVIISSGGILNLAASQGNNRVVSVRSLSGNGTVYGSMQNVATTNNTTLTVNGATGTTTFSGNISNGVTTGAFAVTKTGGSTQIFSGNNTYTGGTTVTAGTLTAASATALGTGTVLVNGGALTTSVSNVTTGGFTMSSGSLTLNSTSAGSITVSTGNLALSGGTWNWSNGDLFTGNGSNTFNVGTVTIDLASFGTAGTYTLATGFNTAGNSLGSISFANAGGGLTATANAGSLTSGNLTFTLAAVATPATGSLTISSAGRIIAGSTGTVSGNLSNTAGSGGNDLVIGLTSTGGRTISSITPASGNVTQGTSTAVSGSYTAGAAGTTNGLQLTNTDGAASPTTAVSNTVNSQSVQDRVITASTVNLGKVLVGSSTGSLTSNLTSAGADNANTRVTVNGTSATDGLATVAAGSSVTYNGTTSGSRSISGTFGTSGNQTGSVSLSTTGEGLAGESVNAVNVGYTATVYQDVALSGNYAVAGGNTSNNVGTGATIGSGTNNLSITNAASSDGGGLRADASVSSRTVNTANGWSVTGLTAGTAINAGAGAVTGSATFSSAGRLNGTYTGTVTLGLAYSDTNIQGIGALSNAVFNLSQTVSGQTATSGNKTMTNGESLAGVGLTNSANGGTKPTGLGTNATILAGTSDGTTASVSFSTSSSAPNDASRVADVVDVTTGTGAFVLQLTYDQALANLAPGGEGSLFLAWHQLSTDSWVNAIYGNTSNSSFSLTKFSGTYSDFTTLNGTDLAATMGAYGIDTTNNTVWAVLNHNSEFTVVPEPSTYAMLLGGVLMMAVVIRRKRNS